MPLGMNPSSGKRAIKQLISLSHYDYVVESGADLEPEPMQFEWEVLLYICMLVIVACIIIVLPFTSYYMTCTFKAPSPTYLRVVGFLAGMVGLKPIFGYTLSLYIVPHLLNILIWYRNLFSFLHDLNAQGLEEPNYFNTKMSKRKDFEKRKENKRNATARQMKAAEVKEQRKVQKEKKVEVLDAQSGSEEILDAQSGIPFYTNELQQYLFQQRTSLFEFGDGVKDAIETNLAFYVAISQAESKSQFASIVVLWLKKYSNKSVFSTVMEYANQVCEFDLLSAQSGDSVDESLPEWIKLLKSMKSDWASVVNSESFAKISHLISLSASLGLCELSHFDVTINGIRLFSKPAEIKHASAIDLAAALSETFIYFVEGGYQCFVQKSLRPIIFSDEEAEKFEAEYLELVDAAALMRSGNLQKYKNWSENEFAYHLEMNIERCDALYKASLDNWARRLLYDKLTTLRKINSDFIQIRADGKLRERPYAFYIFGDSHVGKSTVANIIMTFALKTNGVSADPKVIVTLNETDEYMSSFKTYVEGVVLDDLGNTQAQYETSSPLRRIIDIINNIPTYAVMAELELKGKVAIEPKIVVATSNLRAKQLADVYSRCPQSIVGRFGYHIDVKVRPEFATPDGQLDSAKMAKAYPSGDTRIPDAWIFDVYVPEFLLNKDTLLQKVATKSLPEFLVDVRDATHPWFERQRNIVEFSTKINERMVICEECHMHEEGCLCEAKSLSSDPLEKQSFELAHARLNELVETLNTWDSPWFRWTNYVPYWMFDNRYFNMFLIYLNRVPIQLQLQQCYTLWVVIMCLSTFLLPFYVHLSLLIMLLDTFVFLWRLLRTKRELLMELRTTNGSMPVVFRRIRDAHLAHMTAAGTVLGILYISIKLFKNARNLVEQGNLNPLSMSEISDRDKEVNPWAKADVQPLFVHEKSKTTTHEKLCKRVFDNLHYVVINTGKVLRYCDAFFVKSNLAILPNHICKEDEIKATFYRKAIGSNGSSFNAILSKSFSYLVPGTDFRVFWLPHTWSMKDLSYYLTDGIKESSLASLVYKDKAGDFKSYPTRAIGGTVTTSAATFAGYNYILPELTFNGLCMGALVSNTVDRQILGFHLGGKNYQGGAGLFTLNMLQDAEKHLSAIPGVLVAKSQGTLLTEQYGKNFFEGPQIHEKSPTRFLPEGNNIAVYGSVAGRATFRSEVVSTVISPVVEEVCGVPQQWGKPQFQPSWKPWQASLQYSSCPSIGIEGNLLIKAVEDYKKPLLDIVSKFGDLRTQIKPLSEMATVCGLDGVRFIDKMKPTTAVGYPLTGAKSEYITELDPDDFPDWNCPQELDSMFWDEAQKMKDLYLDGQRAYPIFKASLKDEPTSLSKDKVRVFQAAPVAFQLLIRQYFLPIARVFSLFPLISECAVGVNASGPEWNQLACHMKKYGDDRILAGDYSKYDLRMSCQLISVAFRVMIDMAEESLNYSSDDIEIMKGIATDVSQPVMAYNGDYIQHVGSNPSGQNLTVYINSIVNSILFRCAYFDIYKERTSPPPFREVCALMTYGDDAKGSVKEGYDEFNHVSVADFLGSRDIKFTMPDKESEPVPFMRDEDADFLKRKNIFNSETNLIFGALDEKSIFKSLHSILRSKHVTNEEQCAQNIDGALREWFAYGRDVYESRRAEMNRVAELSNLTYACSELDTTYDMALERFSEKYGVLVWHG